MRSLRRQTLTMLALTLALLPACPNSVMALTAHVESSVMAPMAAMHTPCATAEIDGPTPACCLFHAGDSAGDRLKSVPAPVADAITDLDDPRCSPVAPDAERSRTHASAHVKDFFERSSIQRE